jgi:hypothetical protein
MEVVDRISISPTGPMPPFKEDAPLQAVVIQKVELLADVAPPATPATAPATPETSPATPPAPMPAPGGAPPATPPTATDAAGNPPPKQQ